MDADNISKLIELANSLVYEKTGQHLETVEKDILRQTLIGKKLSAIQFPSYEDSYVQRFRAPRLWNLLSLVAGEKVQKKTVLEVLQRIQSQRYPPEHAIPSSTAPLTRSQSGAAIQNQLIANAQAKNGHAAFNGSVSCPGLKNGDTSKEPDSVAPHQPTPAQAGVSYCINPDCSDRQNPNHLNSCQACGTPLLINGQLRELFEAEHSKSTEDCSPDSTAETSQTDNPDETKSSTYGLPTLMNFMKPGVPLLLSLGVLGCLFALSWLANWYGVTNHLAGQLPKTQFIYRWALKLNPLSAAAHYNQAATYEDHHNYQRAHAEYQLAIEGGLIEAYNNQARLYILAGNYDAAVSLLRIGLELAKDTGVRADMYKNQGWARLELRSLSGKTVSDLPINPIPQKRTNGFIRHANAWILSEAIKVAFQFCKYISKRMRKVETEIGRLVYSYKSERHLARNETQCFHFNSSQLDADSYRLGDRQQLGIHRHAGKGGIN